jgi:hypothetical protein
MEIKIHENTSSEGIRLALSAFGRFSSIEVDEEKNTGTNEKFIIFREIGFFKGLHRLIFKSKEELERSRKNSKTFLYEFSKKRPDIQKLLGSSISERESWQVGEFRKKLKIKTDFISLKKNDDLLHIPLPLKSKVGVIDARVSKIKADAVINWKISALGDFPINNDNDTKAENGNSKKVISVVHSHHPAEDQLRAAYQSALSGAVGQVVISPIVDLPVDQIKKRQPEYAMGKGSFDVCSDQSIRFLLEAIDSALKTNKNIKSVTIARNDAPDVRFISRVLGQRAIIDDEKTRENESQRKFVATMPGFLKLIDKEMREQAPFKVSLDDQYSFKETGLKGVSICEVNPENIIADTAFLSLNSLTRSSSALAEKGKKQLQRVVDLTFKSGGVAKAEADAIFHDMAIKWSIDALELPACELPVSKLFIMRKSVGKDGVERESTKGLSKEFFMAHLNGLSGCVVIDPFLEGRINDGLFEALKELSERPGGGLEFECVIASENTDAVSKFKKNFSEKEALQSSINQREVESNTTTAEIVSPASDRGKFKPKGNKLAPRSGGVHFLNNPPLDLIADRTIVPALIALASGIDALPARDMKEIGPLDTGRLITVPDAFMHSPLHPKLDAIETTFLDILANCSGSVVINPPYDQVDALTKLCSAVYQACEKNPLLSVNFAVTDMKMQENLLSAASTVLISRIDERELDIDGSDEDDLESLSLEWKSA